MLLIEPLHLSAGGVQGFGEFGPLLPPVLRVELAVLVVAPDPAEPGLCGRLVPEVLIANI